MTTRNLIKQTLRAPFRACGLDLTRYIPPVSEQRIEYRSTDWLRPLGIRTILDIGANTGEFSLEMSRRFPTAKIFAFEPLAAAYSQLYAATNDIQRISTINCALGECTRSSMIHHNAYSPSSSLLEMTTAHRRAFPMTATDVGAEVVDVRRLDDWAQQMNLDMEIFIKIDVQGFEDRVIAGGRKTLEVSKALIVEASFVRLYEGQAQFEQVFDALRQLGFRYAGNWEQLYHPREGTILQADAIFLRP